MRVLFWGTPEFAVPTLRALVGEGHDVVGVVTQPDRPSGRGRTLTPTPVRVVAEEAGIPVLTPDRPRGEAFLDELRALDPEISVVVAYGHILLPEVLELPPRKSWNVHASLLPELRGAAPIHWAIARGHARTGVTIMEMEEGLDSGPMLLQVPEEIAPTDTSSGLALRLAEIGAEALIEGLALLEFGDPDLETQDDASSTYAPKVSRAVAAIDWTRSGNEVRDHVRAMDEIPGAWTLWEGQPLKLFSPEPLIGPDVQDAGSGTVVEADAEADSGLGIQTGEGVVRFGEVQPPGKRRMPVGAWLRGRGAAAGDQLGT